MTVTALIHFISEIQFKLEELQGQTSHINQIYSSPLPRRQIACDVFIVKNCPCEIHALALLQSCFGTREKEEGCNIPACKMNFIAKARKKILAPLMHSNDFSHRGLLGESTNNHEYLI